MKFKFLTKMINLHLILYNKNVQIRKIKLFIFSNPNL